MPRRPRGSRCASPRRPLSEGWERLPRINAEGIVVENNGRRATDNGPRRLLFASIHCYLDPSGGAALSTRELLELLAARGWDCRALCCGVLDYQRETTLEEVLAALDRPARRVD